MDAARILQGIRAADGTPIERLEVIVERS
jgi:hypothetical protein